MNRVSSTGASTPGLHIWSPDPLPDNVVRSLDRLTKEADVQHVAVMPDVHLGQDVCVGTVVATSGLLYPAAVGSDIGCGMTAVELTANSDLLDDQRRAAEVLAGLYRCVPTNRHPRTTAWDALPAHLLDAPLSHPQLGKLKHREGRVQFGTLGRGNHFLEFQSDSEGRLWLLVHCGSRAMGQAISTYHVRNRVPAHGRLAALGSDTPEGQDYLQDAAWAIDYARENRWAMLCAVETLLDALFGVTLKRDSLIDSHHNHVQRERHFGSNYWVHRKGAQPAELDQPGVIPGSMGTSSFHVMGRGHADSLNSSSHGAGRRMSRHEARQEVSVKTLTREMRSVWYDRRREGALRDEAPCAYKDIRTVMRTQRDLTRIVRELQPRLVYKG